MRGGDEDHPLHERHRLEDEDLAEVLLELDRGDELVVAAPDRRIPELPASVEGHRFRQQAPHAVPDQDHLVEGGVGARGVEVAADLEQVFTQSRGRDRNGLTRRVEEHPELVAVGDLGVVAEFVDDLQVGAGAGEQPVHEHDGDLPALVGPEHVEPGGDILAAEIGPEEPGDLQERQAAVGHLHGQGGGGVGSQRQLAGSGGEGGRLERVDERDRPRALGVAVGRQDDGRGRRLELLRVEIILRSERLVRIHHPLRDQRHAEAVAAVDVPHADDLEVIGHADVLDDFGLQQAVVPLDGDAVLFEDRTPGGPPTLGERLGVSEQPREREVVHLDRPRERVAAEAFHRRAGQAGGIAVAGDRRVAVDQVPVQAFSVVGLRLFELGEGVLVVRRRLRGRQDRPRRDRVGRPLDRRPEGRRRQAFPALAGHAVEEGVADRDGVAAGLDQEQAKDNRYRIQGAGRGSPDPAPTVAAPNHQTGSPDLYQDRAEEPPKAGGPGSRRRDPGHGERRICCGRIDHGRHPCPGHERSLRGESPGNGRRD